MAINLGQLKIYNFQVDELRPVTNPDQKAAWEKRMKEAVKNEGFKVTSDMQLFDTCCGGCLDDCGALV
jgi:hypothetical protein